MPASVDAAASAVNLLSLTPIPHLRTALDISLSHNCNLLFTVTRINLTQVSIRAEMYTPIIAYLKYEFR